MVQVAILPVFAIVIADISGAGGVLGVKFFLRLRFRQLRLTEQQSRQPFAARRVDKDMECIFALLKNALASTSHNHAVAYLCCLFNDPSSQIRRDFAIEPAGHVPTDVTLHQRVLPKNLGQPVEPRVWALIEFFRHLRRDLGGFRYFFDKAAVEQLPSQAASH